MKKKLHHHFIDHLRSYRTFHFMFFTFVLLITSILIYSFGNKSYAGDLLEEAFKPAMTHETIIDLWNGKNAVGNEVLREWVVINTNLGKWCVVNGEKFTNNEIKEQLSGANYNWSESAFCENILWWERNNNLFEVTTEAPLIVRIAKFLLRITMVLAITMVIFNGIMWIIESSKWAEVKDAKKNIVLIVVGILIALMSLGIVNLITSLTISSLWETNDTVNTNEYYWPNTLI